ncbi:rhodanese-like domain-containing protein [Sphingomicrobium astaxanthinifaciens]|uniref:rhodanese-like domain-containing protein n=1 Tax=Sphingomicrobium astaxanthinifaciens TaxID=1227949 RepID=UPI001FCAB428|nr:rhodanese-like domain-containing protein [Sphingomicrobium astaxanthinifaciens]MCJ7420957.1 rhodanese-like domain-containing protein [Sphingomicrobium astaxanthinifaciens]
MANWRLALPCLILAACGEGQGTREASPSPAEAQAAASVVALSAAEAAAMRAAPEAPTFIDVRTPEEWAEGHVPGARLMPLGQFDPAALDGELVVLYCRSGRRSLEAATMLAEHRGETVAHMDGGFNAWKDAGLPVANP